MELKIQNSQKSSEGYDKNVKCSVTLFRQQTDQKNESVWKKAIQKSMDMHELNQFYLNQEEPNKSCFLALKHIILQRDPEIRETINN